MKYKVAVFDMDGTILDTLEDLKNSVNHALNIGGYPLRSLEEVKGFVGNGIPKLIERACPQDLDDDKRKKVYADFTEHYKVHCKDETHPYVGVNKAISKLKNAGLKVAVVSNKDDYAVKELCDLYFNGAFDFSLGRRDGVNKKPAPDMVNAALKYFGVQKTEAVYLGDSDVDYETAKNSGLDFIGVSWGFKGRAFLEDLGAETIIDSATEIFDAVTVD